MPRNVKKKLIRSISVGIVIGKSLLHYRRQKRYSICTISKNEANFSLFSGSGRFRLKNMDFLQIGDSWKQISEIIESYLKIHFLSMLMPSDVRGGESLNDHLNGSSTSRINDNSNCEPVKLYFYS